MREDGCIARGCKDSETGKLSRVNVVEHVATGDDTDLTLHRVAYRASHERGYWTPPACRKRKQHGPWAAERRADRAEHESRCDARCNGSVTYWT